MLVAVLPKLVEVVVFIPSSRSNKQLLVLDGHIYSEQKKLAGNVILWDCLSRRKANSCNAKVKTLNGALQGRLPQHTHPADPDRIDESSRRDEAAFPKQRWRKREKF